MKRIVLTGPESTGKTTLANYLSKFLGVPIVTEYARTFFEGRAPAYTFSEVEFIASQQYQTEQRELARWGSIVCDTDLTVIKVWMEVRYGNCPQWIDAALRNSDDAFYLLCKPDIVWQPDPLRENPTDRDALYKKYEELLQSCGLPYGVVAGEGEARRACALELLAKRGIQ